MIRIFRINEYLILFYRIFLVYLFYFIARLLFYFYNSNLIKIDSISEFFKLYYHALAFDTAAILYTNSLFILLSILPFVKNTSKGYQRFLTIIYFIFNGIAYATNFIDFIYYRFIFGRTTIAVFDSLEHESNKLVLFGNFLINYWHVFALLIGTLLLWFFLYNKIKVKDIKYRPNFSYFIPSVFGIVVIGILFVGGVRGDFKKSTRPINLIDASRYVNNISQSDFVLNTPFAIIRTLGKNSFKKVDYLDQDSVNNLIKPIKQYSVNQENKSNVVIFILESFAREYVGVFNKDKNIPNYKGYTPFIDSLAQHSMVYTNAYANGYKSIHGMSSVLSGVPSFKDAFTSSPYSKQKIESLVSILNNLGYDTSFFHGAPNGSMGFLGFGNILGFNHYYGKNEFNNDAEFDGVWGIWDEPFFNYFEQELNKKKQPFMATLFSVSSHEPYQIPNKYEGKFPKGDVNIHQTIGYTDFALRQFFNKAKNEPWFNNTIFVFVADHGNTIFYDEYKKELNKNTVPIMFYKPNSNLIGVDNNLAQQIDIYPTILDLIGYKKPFRSWGRSLINDNDIKPFVIKYSNNMYQYIEGDYVCTFDGEKVIGFYNIEDKDLKNNLINEKISEMELVEMKCKAYIQDYFYRIIDKKL